MNCRTPVIWSLSDAGNTGRSREGEERRGEGEERRGEGQEREGEREGERKRERERKGKEKRARAKLSDVGEPSTCHGRPAQGPHHI